MQQQIQNNAPNVSQTATMPNMPTAGNMRSQAAIAGNVNGSMMTQAGMQQNMGAGGMPFNSGNMSSMMNSGKLFVIFSSWNLI